MSLPNLEQVAALFEKDLYRFAWSLAGHTADSEDLVQNTLLRYAQKGHTIRDTDKVKSWLFSVLHREHLLVRKKAARISDVPIDTVMELTTAIDESSTEREAEQGDVLAALDQMEEHLRGPLVLFYLKEMKYREIAHILDLPIGTVMSRISRAKAALRNALGIATILPESAV